jgi:hypothetical protein
MAQEIDAAPASGPRPERPEHPERMPRKVKWAIAGLVFQALGNGLGALVLLSEAQSRVDHGQDGADKLRLVGAVSLVAAVLLAACVVGAVRGAPWVWWLAVGLEAITMLSALIALINTSAPGVGVGMGIAAGIIALLSAPESQRWFGRQPTEARRGPA